MQIYDISEPALPRLVGTYIGPGYQNDVAVSGKIALLATDAPPGPNTRGFDVIDISDPANPKRLAAYRGRRAHAITLVGNLAFPSGNADMDIIDLSDPRNPTKIGTFRIRDTASHIHSVGVRGSLAYLALGEDGGMQVVDISDPRNPREVGVGWDAEGSVGYAHETIARPDGKYVILSDETYDTSGPGGGGHVLDMTDPTAPRRVSTFYADTSRLPPGLYSMHNFNWLDDQKIVTGWYSAGVRVFDLSNPAASEEIGWFVPDGAVTWEAISHRGYIYTGDTARGIDVLKFSPKY